MGMLLRRYHEEEIVDKGKEAELPPAEEVIDDANEEVTNDATEEVAEDGKTVRKRKKSD